MVLRHGQRRGPGAAVKTLLEAGADLFAKDNSGRSPYSEGTRFTSPFKDEIQPYARAAILRNYEAVLARCNKPGQAPPDANTPASAVRHMTFLLYGGEKRDFLDCFVGDAGEMKLVGAFYDLGRAMAGFYRAMTKAYGHEGWWAYQDATGFHLQLPVLDLNAMDSLECEVSGGKATCACPDDWQGFDDLTLVRVDGKWKLNVPKMAGVLAPPGKMAEMPLTWASALRAMTKRVGEKGLTPADFAGKVWKEAK